MKTAAAACAFLCALGAYPARGQTLLPQIESELNVLVAATRRHLVTVIVSPGEGARLVRSVLVASGLSLDDSLVVTAASVVAGNTAIEIAAQDNQTHPAEIVGVDALGGVALLRTAHGARSAGIAAVEAGTPEPGHLVCLVTSSFEERAGFSLGAITSVRPAGMNGQVTTEIEASAAPLPGSAGAVLVDTRGRVMGLVVGRPGRTSGGAAGESGVLAVPLHEVLRIAAELRDHAGVRRNWLGVSVQEMTSALREILGVAPGTGVIVIDVDAHGPATKAGLELGDVILSCDLKVVRDAGELMASVATAPSNARLRLQVFRNGETLELPVVLSELPARQGMPPGLEDVEAPREDRIRAIEEEIARLKASLPHNSR